MLDILQLYLVPVLLEGLALDLYPFIDLLELLWERELVEEVEDGELVERGEVPVIAIGHRARVGGRAGERWRGGGGARGGRVVEVVVHVFLGGCRG